MPVGTHFNYRYSLTLKEYLKAYNGFIKKGETFAEFYINAINFKDFLKLLSYNKQLFPSSNLILDFNQKKLKTKVTTAELKLLLTLLFRNYYNYNIKELTLTNIHEIDIATFSRDINFNNLGRLNNLTHIEFRTCNFYRVSNLISSLSYLKNLKHLSFLDSSKFIKTEEDSKLLANTLLNTLESFVIIKSDFYNETFEKLFFTELIKNKDDSNLQKLVINDIILGDENILLFINSTKFKKLKSLYILSKYETFTLQLSKKLNLDIKETKAYIHNILKTNFPCYSAETFRIY